MNEGEQGAEQAGAVGDADVQGRRWNNPAVVPGRALSALTKRSRRLLTCWRSPSDQPRWARPALLFVAALAGLSYGWGLSEDAIEPFYGAAARSMSMSWRNFFFGAFDPAGTITVDKLPGELWIQALLLRATGFHVWALVLPQVVEGALAVLVLYRAVRRLAGPVAGIVAAVVLAASPITVLLNRGNISDSLLILLLLLGADSASKAIVEGSSRSLIASGIWVGLAFQAKMLEAWIALPALAVAYLVASRDSWTKRLGSVLCLGLAAVVVSLSWMTVVSVIPAHDRPYVDASSSDSEFQQVFDYNGFARFGSKHELVSTVGKPDPWIVAATKSSLNVGTDGIAPAWNRLLRGPFGADDGWLIPAAVLALVGVAIDTRRRRDKREVRAALVLWGLWFALFFAFFSAGVYLNSYYVAVLPPAIGALCGIGASAAWNARRSGRFWMVAATLLSGGYAVFLLPARAGVRTWLLIALGALVVVADLALVLAKQPVPGRRGSVRRLGWTLCLAAMLLVPAATSIVLVVDGFGPFDYPYEPGSVSFVTEQRARTVMQDFERAVPVMDRFFVVPQSVVLTETSVLAEWPILVTGKEFMPIGGLLGADPEPSLSTIERLVETGRALFVEAAYYPVSPDPRLVWIRAHCTAGEYDTSLRVPKTGLYACFPSAQSPEPASSAAATPSTRVNAAPSGT